jgi:hypothetical protein
MYIATVLKFQNGLLQSLGNEDFECYRTGIENAWLIIGVLFWGPILISFMIALIVMGNYILLFEPGKIRDSFLDFFSFD